ncbi:hypothetical protein AVEN_227467-1 [Araneus ventricosus]|uniref:Uncharacterized protein n=1 Tax=Araneus ventricosus TaxID=182803 RepID=A0A4Y2C4B7_ARAVE|nr:hypothetical protein AVEN_227467-1 [Araneus ventricosus]
MHCTSFTQLEKRHLQHRKKVNKRITGSTPAARTNGNLQKNISKTSFEKNYSVKRKGKKKLARSSNQESLDVATICNDFHVTGDEGIPSRIWNMIFLFRRRCRAEFCLC